MRYFWDKVAMLSMLRGIEIHHKRWEGTSRRYLWRHAVACLAPARPSIVFPTSTHWELTYLIAYQLATHQLTLNFRDKMTMARYSPDDFKTILTQILIMIAISRAHEMRNDVGWCGVSDSHITWCLYFCVSLAQLPSNKQTTRQAPPADHVH